MYWDEFNYIDFNIMNEYSKLHSIMIGFTNFNKDVKELVPVNSVFKNNYSNNKFPNNEKIEKEINELVLKLQENNILVYRPTKILNQSIERNNQLYTRDIGFVIKNTLFIPKMILPIRKAELFGLTDLINNLIPNQKNLNYQQYMKTSYIKTDNYINNKNIEIKQNIIFLNKDDCFIEGGDVMLYKDKIFVGIGPRTNMNGFNLLKKYIDENFKEFTMIPIKHECIHLDCCLNIIFENTALICEDYMIDYPDEIKEMNLIKVSKQESDYMLTNILCIGHKILIVNNGVQNVRVNKILEDNGFTLIKIKFNNINLLGGSFRCISMPLARYDILPNNGMCKRCNMKLISCICRNPIPY